MRSIRVGFSPCPNDTFLFYALVHGRVDTEGYVFEPLLEDVETLNSLALEGEIEMTKASYGVLSEASDRYWCLRSGGAMGRGCGPIVVAREGTSLENLRKGTFAVPGLHTTARRLLDLRLGSETSKLPMVFHEVMPAVMRGDVDAGVVIHEGRFTYRSLGLSLVEDLGEWWEEQMGLPIPLGAILLRRGLVDVDAEKIQRLLGRSVEYAVGHPEEPMPYVRAYAQEMDDEVTRRHIELYVNQFSVDMGAEGERAVRALLSAGTNGTGPLFDLFPART